MDRKILRANLNGIVARLSISTGQFVKKGQELLSIEVMKMESGILAEGDMIIDRVLVEEGQILTKGDQILTYHLAIDNRENIETEQLGQDGQMTSSLAELKERKSFLSDDARPAALAKRKSKQQNTARQNIAQLVDQDSFVEYGSLVIAAQRSRRSMVDLIQNTPADGLVAGFGIVNGSIFDTRNRCLVMSYDYTVLAGTQGTMNHLKMDRLLSLARKQLTPVILFAEGGGGRPGDVDVHTIAGLFIGTFAELAGLQGVVPTISIVSGYCFAGNAALAGVSDFIIGTENLSLGMGGPAMIEGGGLGRVHPKDVGPADVHVKSGVIDILVKDDSAAIKAAKSLLSLWQGRTNMSTAADQSILILFRN